MRKKKTSQRKTTYKHERQAHESVRMWIRFLCAQWIESINEEHCIVNSIYHFPMGRSTTTTTTTSHQPTHNEGACHEWKILTKWKQTWKNALSLEIYIQSKYSTPNHSLSRRLCISFTYTAPSFHMASKYMLLVFFFAFVLAHIDHICNDIAVCERIESGQKTIRTYQHSTSKAVFITDIIDISGAYMAMDMNGFSIKLKALYLLFSLSRFSSFAYFLNSSTHWLVMARLQNNIVDIYSR